MKVAAAGARQARAVHKVPSAPNCMRSWSVAQPLSLPDKLIRPSVGGGPGLLPRVSGSTATSAASVAGSAAPDPVTNPGMHPNSVIDPNSNSMPDASAEPASSSPSLGIRVSPGRVDRDAGVNRWVDQSAAHNPPVALAAASAAAGAGGSGEGGMAGGSPGPSGSNGIPPLYPGAPLGRWGGSSAGGSRRASMDGSRQASMDGSRQASMDGNAGGTSP